MTRLFAGTPFDIPPRCDDCAELEENCRCDPDEKSSAEAARERLARRLPPEQQTAVVSLEKRKGNRRVTVVRGLSADANDLPALLSQLQSACGSGGTVRADEDLLEIQGGHVTPVKKHLTKCGYRVK
ncbi:MAG: translation initiation factor [Planctomycetota bacterium]